MHTKLLKQTAKDFYRKKFSVKNSEFRTLNSMINDNSKTPTCIIKDGVTFNKPEQIANVMAETFIEKVETIRNNIKSNPYQAIKDYKTTIPRVEKAFKFKIKRVSEVYEVINGKKSFNTKGNDEITSKIIKTMPHFTALAVCHLYNNIVRTGIFPESLKTARLTPILKPGNTGTDPLGYRPISILNGIEKIIEQLMKDDIEKFLEEQKIILEEHHGHFTQQ